MADSDQLKRPDWIKARTTTVDGFKDTLKVIKSKGVHTVCEENLCPNIGECWKNKTATFLIMGDVCTRNCGFCNIKTGCPSALESTEPERIAEAVRDLGTKYAVITSVTRDDLKDGGAEHFANTIRSIKKLNPDTKVEILTPDFKGDINAINTVIDAKPDVFGHNVEVVKRLHNNIKRPPSSYNTSVNFLKKVKEIKPDSITKTGLIVGVGESKLDVFELIDDMAKVGLNILTIGQYLTPTKSHSPITRYVPLEEFAEYEEYGKKAGLEVLAGPLVRSSYKARVIYSSICRLLN